MAEVNFLAGKMNKDFDERVVPPGQYIDALNIRIGSSEGNSIGALENSKGNTKLTQLQYNGVPLVGAVCIGAIEDGSKETLYWFITKPGVVDMIVSYNTNNSILQYNLVSDNGVLNFDQKFLINGINKIDNLLFWTDGLNPPRKINVDRTYNNPTTEDINVIVAPPSAAPDILLTNQAGEENYIIEKFISFAYRYKYKDNEYSALSQFTDIAFEPGSFRIDYSTFDNVGMQNIFNSVEVSFSTGGENVIGIDLCFKESDSNIVNVIEKYNKKDQAWIDNSTQSIIFNNKKIYTTLLESELLRLYDNVPHVAKAQTIMGNRIMYGNYVDGYDLINDDGNSINLDYSLELVTEDIAYKVNTVDYATGSNYTIDPLNTVAINASQINVDLTGVELKNGSFLTISFNLVHDSFDGDPLYTTAPAPPLNSFSSDFIFSFQRDYSSVNDLATSAEFIAAISDHLSIATSCSGNSTTDQFNCSINAKSGWTKSLSGISTLIQRFYITSSLSSSILNIQCPAFEYTIDDPLNPGTTLYAYEYFTNSLTQSTFSLVGAKKSLHSNRDYEVAIVYMDDYNRSSTALVDTENTIFIPANNSDKKSSIRVTLNSLPPYWATKYKFVVKPSKSVYETIYTNSFYIEDSGFTWFKLDGDNRSKVQDNQTLIVKADTGGVLSELIKTKVLALESKSSDFIINNVDENEDLIIEPAGLYMKLKPSNFAAEYQLNSFINEGERAGSGSYTQIAYPCHIPNENYPDAPGSLPYITYTIPAGSIINIKLRVFRYNGVECDSKDYFLENTYIASTDYDNMFQFVTQQNIDLTAGITSGAGENTNSFNPILGDWTVSQSIPIVVNENQYQFFADATTDALYLVCRSGTPNCSSEGLTYLPLIGFGGNFIKVPQSRISCEITVQRATSLMIFETEALDADGEIYFEGSDSFDIVGGYHMSGNTINDQNQTSSQSAVIDLNFFNCFVFGNGVESYKINDSFVGSPFYLGSRVTAVSQEDFKAADRYAGITYSGIYNADTNINKLNEFNIALANWKDCEKLFGPINKLYGRKTDVLTLQEDKISYVLAGKNLLSDAAGGGAITSIPEVLGTQIARIEEYGISNNPESFAVYGQDIYFTDTKRTAVINLKGGSAQSDELYPISSLGMKNWFRDELKDSFNYQKIGGYDPYLSEYVLTLTNNKFQESIDKYDCGTPISQQLSNSEYTFQVELGSTVGDVSFDYSFIEGSAEIVVVYNGAEVINTLIDESGSVSFTKDMVNPTFVTVTLTPTAASYVITPNCPVSQEITVIRVVVNDAEDADLTITNSFKWTLDTFNSPYNNDYIIFEADQISLYQSETGYASEDSIPAIGSTVTMYSSKLSGDTYNFDALYNKFMYLVSDTLYTEAEVETLVPLLIAATPTLNPSTGVFSSSFVYNNPGASQYLYLVWNYRGPDYSSLDYSTDYSITI